METEIKRIENQIRLANQTENRFKEFQQNNSKFIKPYDQLTILYPHLKKITPSINLDISNSDVYLMKIPKTINLKNLLDVKIDPNRRNKFKIGEEKYILENTDKVPEPKLLVIGGQSNLLNFKGNIFVKKYFKPDKIPELEVPDKQTESLPSSLKHRHPLFGSTFESKLHLSDNVQRKLNIAVTNKLKQDEKMRTKSPKKKKKKRESDQIDELIFDLLTNKNTAKNEKSVELLANKNKIKKEMSTEEADILNDKLNQDEKMRTNTPKKKKRKRESDQMDELIFDLLANKNTAKREKSVELLANKNKIKREICTEEYILNDKINQDEKMRTNTPKKKKKKRESDQTDELIFDLLANKNTAKREKSVELLENNREIKKEISTEEEEILNDIRQEIFGSSKSKKLKRKHSLDLAFSDVINNSHKKNKKEKINT